MRKWTIALMVGGMIVSGASVASAQLRRRQSNQQEYQAGQGQYPQQGVNQGNGPAQQYQQGGQPWTANRYATQRVSGQAQGANSTDQQLANWLLVDNRNEIQLGRLAEERASSDDVKEFAKQMVDQHAQVVEELQRFAGVGQQRGSRQENSRQDDAQDDWSHSGQSTQAGNNRGGQQYQQASPGNRGGQPSGGLNLVRLKQQLGQQCVASAQRELEQKDGDEFDKCYVGMQIAMHMQMLDTLKVFSRYASPDLDQLIEQAEQTTQDHLDHAKHLIKQLEGDKENGSSDRPSSRSRNRSSSDREARSNRDSNED